MPLLHEDLLEEVLLFLRHAEDVSEEGVLAATKGSLVQRARLPESKVLVEPSSRLDLLLFNGGVWNTGFVAALIIYHGEELVTMPVALFVLA